MPAKEALLIEPKIYYNDFLNQYLEKGLIEKEIDNYLKKSYINELEIAIKTNNELYKKKRKYHFRALLFVLVASLPYLICLAFYFQKDNKIQKSGTVNTTKSCNFVQSKHYVVYGKHQRIF